MSGPVRLSLADDDVDLTRILAFVRPHLGGASTEDIPDVLYHMAYLGKDGCSDGQTQALALAQIRQTVIG